MPDLAPLHTTDARRIIDSTLADAGMTLSPVGERDVVGDLESRMRFDHSARRLFVVDDAGNPVVTVENGAAREVTLDEHLRSLAGRTPAAFAGPAVPEATTENPFRKGASFNRTKQAIITNRDPELAARMKAEAGR